MPGFILAFAEAQVLAQLGFDFWDLGGVNSSPMMQYKPQVALEMRREVWLDVLTATHRRWLSSAHALPGRVPAGVHVEEIGEGHLWGAALAAPEPPPRGKRRGPGSSGPGRPPGPARTAAAPVEAPPEAGAAAPAAVRARFAALVQELRAGGLDAEGAAAEALLRMMGQARESCSAA